MDSHAILAWNSMRGSMEGAGAWGVPESRRRPGMLRDQAMTYRRHRVRGALAACATLLLVAASSVAAAARRRGRARPEEGARPWPRHGDHPRPLLLPGPRPASRPALHSRQHRPRRHPGRHPLHHLQEGLDGHGPAPGTPDRAVQVRRGLPGLRHAPIRADRAGPPRPAGTRRQQRRHQLVAGVPADTEPEGQG